MGRNLSYRIRSARLQLPRGGSLEGSEVSAAAQLTNKLFEDLEETAPFIYPLLGLRNLSAFVGAAFAQQLEVVTNQLLRLNPHQDGYPDLLLMDKLGREKWSDLAAELRDKAPFSPFPSGGIEVKATVGDLPTPTYFTDRGLVKPDLGDERIDYVRKFNWKAHHRETNWLVGLLWDFAGRIPAVTAVMFSADLTAEDWGSIVQPRAGGGRTTSVSIMNRNGVRKMAQGLVLVLDDSRYEKLIQARAD